MKRKQKYRLSILLSLTTIMLFMFGLKQRHSPHVYAEKQNYYRNATM